MKAKPSLAKREHDRPLPPAVVTDILPILDKPLTEPLHPQEHPGARGTHGSASRTEIRHTTHRVMGSRQSQRPVERHDQPRKKRG